MEGASACSPTVTIDILSDKQSPLVTSLKVEENAAPIEVSKYHKVSMVIIFCLNLSVLGLDGNVLGDASPFIAATFNAYGRITWIANTTSLVAACLLLMTSKLYCIYEPKFVLLASLLLMSVSQALAGASSSFEILLAGRALAGISQAMSLVGCTTITGYIFNSQQRPLMVSVVIACYGLMIKVGPLVAGAILKRPHSPWRWCFYFKLPLLFVLIVMTILCFPRLGTFEKRSPGEIWKKSWLRVLLQGATVACLSFPLVAGGTSHVYRWGGPSLVVCYVLGSIVLALFFYLEIHAVEEDRLLPIEAMKADRSVALMGLITFCSGYMVLTSCFFLPIMFELVFESSPLRAAVQLLPSALLGTIATVVVGKVAEKTGHFIPSCIVLSVVEILGSGLSYTWHSNSPLWKIYVFSSIGGIGCGGLASIGTPFTLEKVSIKRYAEGAAFSNFCLVYGAVIGISVQSIILSNKIGSVGLEIHKIDPSIDLSSGIWKSFIFILAGPKEAKVVVEKAFMEAIDINALVYVGIGTLSLAASLGLRRQKMHQHSHANAGVVV